jgi:hypothetical protein
MSSEFIDRFLEIVDEGASRLLSIRDDVASEPRAPAKWSRKEIVGHLIDSAINNHARFVRAQMQDDLIFSGYDQDAWVRLQRYQDRSWTGLIHAWRTYNAQIAEIMRATPRVELDRPRLRHNLQEIGFRPLPPGSDATLGFLMRDYVEHLQHHLRQVLDNV